MHKEHHLRSFVKGLTWRAVGTTDTILISFLVTGHAGAAFGIGFTELFTKLMLYYFHERLWSRFAAGAQSRRISLLKGISWRVTGTLDTLLISLLFTNNFAHAGQIASFEVFTKLGLFYLHERLWMHVRWGRSSL